MKTQIALLMTAAFILGACTQTPQNSAPSEPITKQTHMTPQLIQITSNLSFEDTLTKLRSGISQRPLKLFAEIDHAAGAATADLSLPPSTLFIFGNPKGGTPLMQRNPQMGIVLPLKMHVYQDGETVFITYPDIEAVAAHYGLDPSTPPVPNIAAMLKALAEEVSN